MPYPLVTTGAEVGAWVAAIAGIFALVSQAYSALRKRQQEKDELEEALDQSPEVKKQLELGNVGQAVAHLNLIMESQATYIRAQDERINGLVAQVGQLTDLLQARDLESSEWESKYNDEVEGRRQDRRDYDRSIYELKQELAETKRVFARRLGTLTSQLHLDEGMEDGNDE